jgi:predicted phage terminase large subunit-like protein
MAATQERIEFRPQPGPQEEFLSTPVDIAFYGGAAGGGKTTAVMLEQLRNIHVPEFGSVIFRRTMKQVLNEGGLWDESMKMFPYAGGVPNQTDRYWKFPAGSAVSFAHLEHEKNIFDWQGAQIPLICFEELTHFTKRMFFYMLSRNRSTCGVKPYVRATMNPDKNSWVRDFIDWYIFPKGHALAGYANPARAGKIRYFIVENDTVIWKDRLEDFSAAEQKYAKSFTFIPAKVTDNKILMEKDPGYLANLKALPRVARMQLLDGNWDAEEAPGEYFRKEWFKTLKVERAGPVSVVRYWDRAGSEKKGADWTVGVLLARYADGHFCVLDVVRFRGSPSKVEERIQNVAAMDALKYRSVMTIWIEQDPGQAGKMEAEYQVKKLAGYDVRINKPTESKATRAGPASAQVEIGNVSLLEAPWNEDFVKELQAFPDGGHDDQVDAFSGAFMMMQSNLTGTFTEEMAKGTVNQAPSKKGKELW